MLVCHMMNIQIVNGSFPRATIYVKMKLFSKVFLKYEFQMWNDAVYIMIIAMFLLYYKNSDWRTHKWLHRFSFNLYTSTLIYNLQNFDEAITLQTCCNL